MSYKCEYCVLLSTSPAIIRRICIASLVFAGLAAATDMRLESAQKRIEKGDYEKAVQEYRLYLSEHPEAGEIYGEIGKIRMQQGNFKLAADNFKVALNKKPDLLPIQEALAQAYEKNGENDKAKAVWYKLAQRTQDPAQKKRALKHWEDLDSPPYEKAAPEKSQPIPKPEPVSSHENKKPVSKPIKPIVLEKLDAPPHAIAKDAEGLFDASLKPEQMKGPYAQVEFDKALQLYQAGEYANAQKVLRECLRKNPQHPGAFYLGGLIRYKQKDYSKATYNFKRAGDYPEKGVNAHYFLGRIYQKQNLKADAQREYKKYLQEAHSASDKRQVQSWLQELQGNSLVTEEHAVEKDKGHDTKAHAPDEAVHAEKVAEEDIAEPTERGSKLILKPLHTDATLGITFYGFEEESPAANSIAQAIALYQQEKMEKAITQLKQILLQYGGTEYANAASLDLAALYLKLGLNDNAIAQAENVLRGVDANSLLLYQAQFILAHAYLQKKDWEKAERLLVGLKSKNLSSPSAEILDFHLTQVGEMSRDEKKWAAYLEKAADNPLLSKHKKARIWQQLGTLYMRSANPTKGLEFLHKAMADCSDSLLNEICSEAQVQVADLDFRNKKWAEAKKEYQTLAKRNPRFKEGAWVHYQLANVYKELGNYEMALNEYKLVIDNYPYSYWAVQAKWQREDTIWRKQYEGIGN